MKKKEQKKEKQFKKSMGKAVAECHTEGCQR